MLLNDKAKQKMIRDWKAQEESNTYTTLALKKLEERDYEYARGFARMALCVSQNIEQRIALKHIVEVAEAQDEAKIKEVIELMYR